MSSRPLKSEDGFIRYFPFSDPNVQVVLSLKDAGDMSDPDGEAREAFCRNAGVDRDRLYSVSQVHSRRILSVDGRDHPSGFRSMEADGLITSNRSAALAVTVADCVPVFLFNPRLGLFGAFHSGWKGTGIILDAIEEMRRLWNSEPGETEAFIGPAVGPCCYLVDRTRADIFEERFGAEEVVRGSEGAHLNLAGTNERLLDKAGVPSIIVDRTCTCCDTRFGSYRRQGADTFDRMLALISFFG